MWHNDHRAKAAAGGDQVAPEGRIRIQAQAPTASVIQEYDRQQLTTYVRLLDAANDGQDWESVAREVLFLDVKMDREVAWRCWTSHLSRARWIASEGWAQAIAEAEAN